MSEISEGVWEAIPEPAGNARKRCSQHFWIPFNRNEERVFKSGIGFAIAVELLSC